MLRAGSLSGTGSNMPYHFIDHTGDVAVELHGEDEAGLLNAAARALAAVFLGGEAGEQVAAVSYRDVDLEAEDPESLLIDFLNELIFLLDGHGFLCVAVEPRTVDFGQPASLQARLAGEYHDPARHGALTEVKAATFHDVRIVRSADGLRSRVVFDL